MRLDLDRARAELTKSEPLRRQLAEAQVATAAARAAEEEARRGEAAARRRELETVGHKERLEAHIRVLQLRIDPPDKDAATRAAEAADATIRAILGEAASSLSQAREEAAG